MTNLIFTIKIGSNPNWDLCIKTQQEYCAKYNIRYIVLQERRINFPFGPNPTANFYFEKLQVVPLMSYCMADRVLYMDSDILITPHARNIFDVYGDSEKYYGFDESKEVGIIGPTMFGTTADIMDRDPYVKSVLPNIPTWKKNKLGKYIYYNMGVMLFSKHFVNNVLASPTKLLSLQKVPHIYDFNDQTYFNGLIQKFDVPNDALDYSFNRMHLGLRDDNNERYKADFIHYAGPCLYNIEGEYSEEGKRTAVIKDYNTLYGS